MNEKSVIYKEFANGKLFKSIFSQSSDMMLNRPHKGARGRDFPWIVQMLMTVISYLVYSILNHWHPDCLFTILFR